MSKRTVFQFELGASIPICAKRAFDLSGFELSEGVWRSLDEGAQERIAQLGAKPIVDATLLRGLLADCVSEKQPGADPSSQTMPKGLVEQLGDRRPFSLSSWASLSSLERYAIEQLLSSGHESELVAAYDEIVGASGLSSHLSVEGQARMVDVSLKQVTQRRAVASASVKMDQLTLRQLSEGEASKGDVIAASRIAGIMAAKRTSELIPLCHPIATTKATIEIVLDWQLPGLRIRCAVDAVDRTGVEMEAMTGVSVAALTIYDMLKGIDRAMVIESVQLELKEGGRSGRWERQSTI